MTMLNPADELTEIRAKIARLQARETALCEGFLRDPDTAAVGKWSRVDVVQVQQLRFDANLLPQHILSDPDFLRESVVKTVLSMPLPRTPLSRPGWPIRREAAALH